MAYLRSVTNDIFVSYAHLDNLAASPQPGGGWVRTFVELLEVQLKKRLGSGAVSMWTDWDLPGHKPITPEILGAVRDSALLLIVMSPSYLRSTWCARERNAFLEIARDRLEKGRVFLVRCLDVPLEERPVELGDLNGYPFYATDPETGVPRPLGDPDPTEPAFLKQVYTLSYHLAKELMRLASNVEPATAARAALSGVPSAATAPGPAAAPFTMPASASDGSRVFVARATDDLEDREEELRNYLAQSGFSVFARRQYTQADEASFDAAVRADLDQSKVFVQLVSAARGPEMPFGGPRRLPLLQWEIANRIGKKLLVWRDRSLDPSAIANAEHRALAESAIACPIEEFKRAVTDELRREPPKALTRPSAVMVFVDTETRDRELAVKVGEALAQQGIACYWPLDKGTPEEIRKDLEANLRDSDGVIIVYGSSEPYWVREQVRFGLKVFSDRPRRPALAICEGPPPEKSGLGLIDPGMLVLDCSRGIDAGAFQPFVARLRPPR